MALFEYGSKVATEIHKIIHDAKFGRQVCTCGADLTKCGIEGYKHGDGWNVRIKLRVSPFEAVVNYWLYITCPKCGYQWAIWKLGVDRNQEFSEV